MTKRTWLGVFKTFVTRTYFYTFDCLTNNGGGILAGKRKKKSDCIYSCKLTIFQYFQLNNILVINMNDKNFYLNSLHIETYVLDPTSRLLPLIVTIVFPCRGPNVGLIEYTTGT